MDEGHSIESLAAYSKGFVAGLDGGLVALFDRDEREYYRRTRTFTVMDHPLQVRCATSSCIKAAGRRMAPGDKQANPPSQLAAAAAGPAAGSCKVILALLVL